MNNNPYVNCSEFGLPHLRMYYDGSMYHELRQEWIMPQPCSSNIELVEYCGAKRVRITFSKLYGYYFRAPWNQHIVPRYRVLTHLGLSNYCILEDGSVFSLYSYDYISGTVSQDGYCEVMLSCDNNTHIRRSRHRLVALAFLPNPDNRTEVNHIDGVKLNNHVSNLEWVWPYENMEHALNTGLRYRANSDDTIHLICQHLEKGERIIDIAHELKVQKHNIKDIKSGCHARISKQYDIPKNRHFNKNKIDWASNG